jgi:tyrosine-specific transport protein
MEQKKSSKPSGSSGLPWYNLSRYYLLGAVFTLVGTIIGAGVLGIPYVIAKSGFWTGIFVIFAVFIITLLMYLYMGEVVLRTNGKHQLPGYAGIYLGSFGRKIMSFAMILGTYGSIIAYIFAGGKSLNNLLGGFIHIPLWGFNLIFFAALSILIYFNMNIFEDSEMAITFFLIIAVFSIFIFSAPHIAPENYQGFDLKNFFIPYGVVFFAFMGFVGVPEAAEELGKHKKSLFLALFLGILIPLIVYLVFAFSIVGMMGVNTQELGTMNIEQFLGTKGFILGNLFLLFSVSTSFLALSFGLKEYFIFDRKMPHLNSWALSCIIPVIIFLLLKNWASFTQIISVNGIILGGTEAIIVVLMAYRAKILGKRKPEYSFPINLFLVILFIAFILAGMTSLFF